MKFLTFLTFVGLTSSSLSLHGQMPKTAGQPNSIDALRYTVSNHESEIRRIEAKFENLESIIDNLRSQLKNASVETKESSKNSSLNVEGRFSRFDQIIAALSEDLKQQRAYGNELSTLFNQYRQSLMDIEQAMEVQNRNILQLQSSLHSLLQAFQAKTESPVAMATYEVKSGDSLEKIASANKTSVKAIKESNGLKSDKIVIGQKLKIDILQQ